MGRGANCAPTTLQKQDSLGPAAHPTSESGLKADDPVPMYRVTFRPDWRQAGYTPHTARRFEHVQNTLREASARVRDASGDRGRPEIIERVGNLLVDRALAVLERGTASVSCCTSRLRPGEHSLGCCARAPRPPRGPGSP